MSLQQKNKIIIIGGGWSVRAQGVDVDRLKNFGHVIGVNTAGILADVDEVVSMDRLWMEHYFDRLKEMEKPTHLRFSSWRVNLRPRGTWDDLHLFENDHESYDMSTVEGRLNGFNSGVCAMNLAYQMAAGKGREVYLFGFDHCRDEKGNPYWHPPHPWTDTRGATTDGKYTDWSKKFVDIAHQFKRDRIPVLNVSPRSSLTNFPKVSYEEFLSICVN